MKTGMNALLKAGRMLGASRPNDRMLAHSYLKLALKRAREEQISDTALIASYSIGFRAGLECSYKHRLDLMENRR